MLKLFLRWGLNALALTVIPAVISSIHVGSYASALIAALVLGLVNALIRPVLLLLTLPITLLSLGLFALVINALLFWAVANILDGFSVPTFGAAFFGALLYSILTGLVSLALGEK